MTPHRSASVLLLCIALVAAASMVAFSFALTAQSAAQAGGTAISLELARSAARMGARHAMQVAVTRLGDAYANENWSQREFGHLDRFDPANKWPQGSVYQTSDPSLNLVPPATSTAVPSPNPFHTNEDNVQADTKLFFMHYGWGGDSSAAYQFNGISTPWSNPGDAGCVLFLDPGVPRWIEPGYHNANGLTDPIRFSQVPGTPPSVNHPAYFDADWHPAPNRSMARYRLRYAVSAFDLGGYYAWGRQLDYSDANPHTHATATPHEWDERTARTYLRPFCALMSAGNVSDTYPATDAGVFIGDRSRAQFAFLGHGYDMVDGLEPGFLLSRFEAGPRLKSLGPFGLYITPGHETRYPVESKVASMATGGPTSWMAAAQTGMSEGFSMGAMWMITPFGRANRLSASPARYDEGFSSCPWRINVLTAPPETLSYMLAAYAPQITRRFLVNDKEGFTWDTATAKMVSGGTVALSPAAACGPVNPGPDVHTADFLPPEAATSPFAGFSAVQYTLPGTATDYTLMYPGPPADWEDYAAIEADPAKRSNNGVLTTAAVHALMLGTQVTVHHDPDAAGNWTATAGTTRRSVVSGNTYAANLDGTGATAWNGLPAECMRGSAQPIAPFFGAVGSLTAATSYHVKTLYRYLSSAGPPKVYTTGMDRFHRDSYWFDLTTAMAGAFALTKALHQDATWVGAVSIPHYKAVLTPQAAAKATSVQELDRLFLSILGEWFPGDANAPGSTTTSKPGLALLTRGTNANPFVMGQSARAIIDFTCAANIRQVKAFLGSGTGPALAADVVNRKAANMERVLNDMRLSFFGANGTYAAFRPLDFDGDGFAVCSGYTASHPSLALSDGRPIPARAVASAGIGPAPDVRFSLTGCVAFDKVRFVRALVRGQVWDELRQQAVSDADLDTVFTVDPDGDFNPATGDGLGDNATLYCRWMRNLYQGQAVRTAE